VLLNACFTKTQARAISEVVDYSIGASRPIGDKVSVAFAGAFYRALGFGKAIRDAFNSARAELALTKMPRSRGIELFVRNGVDEEDRFPQINTNRHAVVEVTTIKTIQQQTILVSRLENIGRRRDSIKRTTSRPASMDLCWVTAAPCTAIRRREMPFNVKHEATVKNLTRRQAQSTSGRKAPGTRIGLYIDWREGSATSGRLSRRYGRSLRDGQ
jgi:hypothetical protein